MNIDEKLMENVPFIRKALLNISALLVTIGILVMLYYAVCGNILLSAIVLLFVAVILVATRLLYVKWLEPLENRRFGRIESELKDYGTAFFGLEQKK